MTDISYIEADEKGLDQIQPLWEKVIEHIRVRSTYFGPWYEERTFELRKAELLAKSAAGKLHIDLAVDGRVPIGYCVSSLYGKTGEIDSIFVEEMHRSSGIGGQMIKRALAWLEKEQAESIRVACSIGNEEVLPFYRHFGFFPRQILLEMKRE